jgi:ankyrin repeat protein
MDMNILIFIIEVFFEILNEENININSQDKYGETIFSYACLAGSERDRTQATESEIDYVLDIWDLALTQNTPITMALQNIHGQTVLDKAIQQRNLPILELIGFINPSLKNVIAWHKYSWKTHKELDKELELYFMTHDDGGHVKNMITQLERPAKRLRHR